MGIGGKEMPAPNFTEKKELSTKAKENNANKRWRRHDKHQRKSDTRK